MVDVSVQLALVTGVVAISAVAGPLISIILQSRGRRADAEQARIDRAEDWARQDLVASRVEAATRSVAIGQAGISGKLEELHVLGNSTLTGQMQLRLTTARAGLVSMQALTGSKKDTAAIAALKEDIKDQEATLVERQRAAHVAEQQKEISA